MTPARLRRECLSDPENTVLSMMFVNNELVGHAIATRWHHQEGKASSCCVFDLYYVLNSVINRLCLLDNTAGSGLKSPSTSSRN